MSSVTIVLAAIALLSVSGLPAYLFPSRFSFPQRMTTIIMLLGAVCGICGVIQSIINNDIAGYSCGWLLPIGAFSINVDSLSKIFLLPVFIIPALGSIYGLGYWKQKEHPENGRKLGVFYGLLAGSMALVLIASDSVLFIIAWEIMALAAFFAATVEDGDKQVRQAGWVYLVSTHIGTLFLLAMFALWRYETGSFALVNNNTISIGIARLLFVFATIGFGFKAGLIPLHVWLPGAHANAPSHVSAVMSGVMLKIGIYGIIRMSSLLQSVELWWGGLLVLIGAITAIAGIAFALGQQDIKRILAYSSIENIGIIVLGLGLALAGKYYNRADLIIFGMGGALLHVWNHGLFKSLLFFNTGVIIHVLHSRDIELMGGLGKQMPRTMGLFIVGAIAITALPPMNGFISEWLLYLGFFHSIEINGANQFSILPIGAIALAVVGPLALACFVKVLGAVFLGTARSSSVDHVKEPSASMVFPMLIPAIGCVLIGLFPEYPIKLLMNAVEAFLPSGDGVFPVEIYNSLYRISYIGMAILIMSGVLLFIFRKKFWDTDSKVVGTWDCGYARLSKRMQYSGASFSDTIVQLFGFILYPIKHNPVISGLFPQKANFRTSVPDTILDRLVLPFFRNIVGYLTMIRVFQKGQIHLYVFYILLIILVLFVLGR